jgi:carboxymethylenebutenolidase
MKEQMVRVSVEDGHIFDAFRVSPENPKGGLVILQEIFGMTEQLKSVTRGWAADGYDTILPAMYDRIKSNCVLPFSDMEGALQMMEQIEPDDVAKDVRAACDVVDRGLGFSALGFCWGGGTAVQMANRLNLKGAISYYGTRLEDNTAGGARCPTLFHFGESDQHSKPELIEKVKSNIPDAEYYVYKAGHAFANDARPEYFAEAATKLARQRSLKFLNRVHGNTFD